MKKLLFAAYSLDVGGIEKALVTLLNKLQKKDYEITLILEKKQGIFLDELNKKIIVLEYTPDNNKNIIKRKTKNFIKKIKFFIKYYNKFDFSASFATYSKSSSYVSRVASKNSYLWGHADYLSLYDNDIVEMKKFFKKIKCNAFKNIIFVSNEGKESFIKVFPKMKQKVFVCNNLIDGEKIRNLSNKKIEIKKEKNKITFINVGRHDEKQKKLTRIIEASKILKDQGINFCVWFVGDGKDEKIYRNLVKKENLENEIIFLGRKKNPYPYIKNADCVLLTSDYEGYPVVFLESFILNKPIITTKVSDYEQVKDKYGLIAEKNVKDIAEKMKYMVEKGFRMPTNKFDEKKYNDDIMKKIEKLF